jgi:hypothetical protein
LGAGVAGWISQNADLFATRLVNGRSLPAGASAILDPTRSSVGYLGAPGLNSHRPPADPVPRPIGESARLGTTGKRRHLQVVAGKVGVALRRLINAVGIAGSCQHDNEI